MESFPLSEHVNLENSNKLQHYEEKVTLKHKKTLTAVINYCFLKFLFAVGEYLFERGKCMSPYCVLGFC